MAIISAFMEYINSETMSPIGYDNFRMQTDKSIIVRLKCASYCPFYMHITSIVFLYVIAPCL